MRTVLLILTILSLNPAFAQGVGIGTTNPLATLHIAGPMQYTPATINAVHLVGIDTLGQLGTIKASLDFKIENNKLVITNDASDFLKVEDQPLSNNVLKDGNRYDNFNVGIVGIYETTPVFRFNNAPGNYNITGFVDGINGKHFFFMNEEAVNITFLGLDSRSDAQNQIIVVGDNGISGKGIAEFLYDGASQKWLLINIIN